jgi:hypothetical protein
VEPNNNSCHLEVDEVSGMEGGGAWSPIDKCQDLDPRSVSSLLLSRLGANKKYLELIQGNQSLTEENENLSRRVR